jgi:hypothetical protein
VEEWKGERKMAQERREEERRPFWQVVLDEPFLLLTLGLGIPLVLYLIWGIFELTTVPFPQP